jgi:CO dehydrogenase maturation factor
MSHPLAGLRIGFIGKGGSGKSTLVALCARTLLQRGYEVIVLDADSTNIGLDAALGVDAPPRPLLEYFGGSVFSGGVVTCPVDDPTTLAAASVDLYDLADGYASRSPSGIYLLVAGKLAELGPGAGCDGPIAKITRDLEVRPGSDRGVTLVDLKAGFEDSARGVIVRLDAAVAVVDGTIAAVQMAAGLSRLVEAIRAGGLPATRHLDDRSLVEIANDLYRGARIRRVFVVLNKVPDADTEAVLRTALANEDVPIAGVIHEDAGITRAWLLGAPLDGQPLDRNVTRVIEAIESAARHWRTHDDGQSAEPATKEAPT